MSHIRPDVLNYRAVAEHDDCTDTPIRRQSRTEDEQWGRRVHCRAKRASASGDLRVRARRYPCHRLKRKARSRRLRPGRSERKSFSRV